MYNNWNIRAYFRKQGHGCDFLEKGKNSWKFGQKCTKFENIFKNSSLMRATIACMKELNMRPVRKS